MRPFVDFVIAGVQKCGTTALFDYMADEPAYNLSRVKEVHFFDDESIDWNAPDYRPYHAQFDWSRPGARGEATPIYLYWPRSLERIAAYNPAMRLIVLLRDPVERAWSHWRMETVRGVERRPFSWCIREGRRRLQESTPWGVHREYSYVERGFYGEQVERLLAYFPRDQVLVLRGDDLRAAPGAVLDQVAAFLGAAPPDAPIQHRDVHVGQEVGGELDPRDAEFLRELYAEDMDRLARLTGVTFR